ncbi:MAG: hypothetical protein CBD56_01185 [Candidatus Pelagibacter sp. TMED196]|nr:MAG: hypothetical protein CBD56_01185 [Candidatus Pelagibacter sp. TMED196]|tara:strand:+ start:624 stop:806 length:183 start_codon:yes stop_codon:yes gene_type:complete
MRYGNKEEVNEKTFETSQKVDLNDLMQKVRDEEKRNRRTSVYLSAAAISAFAVFGIILTL